MATILAASNIVSSQSRIRLVCALPSFDVLLTQSSARCPNHSAKYIKAFGQSVLWTKFGVVESPSLEPSQVGLGLFCFPAVGRTATGMASVRPPGLEKNKAHMPSVYHDLVSSKSSGKGCLGVAVSRLIRDLVGSSARTVRRTVWPNEWEQGFSRTSGAALSRQPARASWLRPWCHGTRSLLRCASSSVR